MKRRNTIADLPFRQRSSHESIYYLSTEITNKPLAYKQLDHIQIKILNPLGLVNFHHLLSEVVINDLMSRYFIDYPDDIKYNDFIQPGGSMVATTEDVGIFLRVE